MTKYVVSTETEDNVDLGKWTDLLLDSDSDSEKDDTDTHAATQTHCLISHDLLDKNFISLPCNHYFNFLPLYFELLRQNTRVPNLHCPYCRTVHIDTVLPHVKLNKTMVYRQGVNQPVEFCLPFHTCDYIFSSGKQKGNKCGATAFITSDGTFCAAHHKTVKIQKEKELVKIEKQNLKQKLKIEKLMIKEEEKKQKKLEKQIIKEEKQNKIKELKLLKQQKKYEQKLIKQKLKDEKKQLKKENKIPIMDEQIGEI